MKIALFVLSLPVIIAIAYGVAMVFGYLLDRMMRSEDIHGYVPISAVTLWCILVSLGIWLAWKLIGL